MDLQRAFVYTYGVFTLQVCFHRSKVCYYSFKGVLSHLVFYNNSTLFLAVTIHHTNLDSMLSKRRFNNISLYQNSVDIRVCWFDR